MLIDTHCHLDFYPNPEKIAQETERQGIYTIAVTNLPSHFETGLPHVQKFKKVRLALGLHPLMVKKHTKLELDKFQILIARTSYIGEIGLDFSSEGYPTRKSQVDSLCYVLNIIKDKPRFISLHSRGAESEVLELLNSYKIINAVFHWYSGSLTTLEKILQTGHYLSINPAMLNTKKGQKIIERLPQNRVLTETDGPHVKVGAQAVIPENVKDVLSYLAKVWNISETDAKQQVFNNFERIIKPIRKTAP